MHLVTSPLVSHPKKRAQRLSLSIEMTTTTSSLAFLPPGLNTHDSIQTGRVTLTSEAVTSNPLFHVCTMPRQLSSLTPLFTFCSRSRPSFRTDSHVALSSEREGASSSPTQRHTDRARAVATSIMQLRRGYNVLGRVSWLKWMMGFVSCFWRLGG